MYLKEYKFKMQSKTIANSKCNRKRLQIPLNSFLEPIYINGDIIEAEEQIMIKNVSSVISEILGCSRQNVDSILRRGNANKIRELDYMALQYIERVYRE